MKRLKLKQTVLCQLVLYFPVLVFIALGFSSLALNNLMGMILFLVFEGVALIYLFRLFLFFMQSDLLFATIRYWKKDRLWYVTDCNGTMAEEIANTISCRVKKYGVSCGDYVASQMSQGCVQYKRCCSLTKKWSAIEKIIIAYQVENLTNTLYKKILDSSKQIATQLQIKSRPYFFQTKEEREAPVCRAVAVIIIANQVEYGIPELARQLPDFEELAILPCVIDLYTKRYYFDGMKEYSNDLSGNPSKNYAIDLVKRIVFNGRLPLDNNTHFDYTRMNKADLDKTLYDYIKEYFENIKEEKRASIQLMERMHDGEILQEDDTIFLKREGKVAVFFVVNTKTKSVELIIDQYWTYPKRRKIPIRVLVDLEMQTEDYFLGKGIQVKIVDEIK